MSNLELHNSYKCYDGIPTPPDDGFNKNATDAYTMKYSNLIRSASLDSLINSSDQDSSVDGLSDSDSLCELKNTGSYDNKSLNQPRNSDIEQIKNIEPSKELVIKAYLEKSHKSCDYENCGFKKESEEKESNCLLSTTSVRNRRNSVAHLDSIRRMETILEEPVEPKRSVKEILACFETMRETMVKLKKSQFLTN